MPTLRLVNLSKEKAKVEKRAVRVHSRQRHLGAPIGHEVFRRNNPFLDPGWRPGPMAAGAEDALAPVRVCDQ